MEGPVKKKKFYSIYEITWLVWEPTWKTVTTMSQANELLKDMYSQRWKGPYKSIFTCLMFEMSAYTFLMEFYPLAGYTLVYRHIVARDENNKIFSGLDLDFFESAIGPKLPHHSQLGVPPVAGRLGHMIFPFDRLIRTKFVSG